MTTFLETASGDGGLLVSGLGLGLLRGLIRNPVFLWSGLWLVQERHFSLQDFITPKINGARPERRPCPPAAGMLAKPLPQHKPDFQPVSLAVIFKCK